MPGPPPPCRTTTGRPAPARRTVTGTSDSVGPFWTERGVAAYLSNREWVINAAAVSRLERQFGGSIMPMINKGQLPVDAARGFSGGIAAKIAARGSAAGGQGPGPMTVEVTNHFHGVNLADDASRRKVAETIRQEIISIERAYR